MSSCEQGAGVDAGGLCARMHVDRILGADGQGRVSLERALVGFSLLQGEFQPAGAQAQAQLGVVDRNARQPRMGRRKPQIDIGAGEIGEVERLAAPLSVAVGERGQRGEHWFERKIAAGEFGQDV